LTCGSWLVYRPSKRGHRDRKPKARPGFPPGGQQLLAEFKQVFQQSVRADEDFIGWMQDFQNSGTCPVKTSTDAAYRAGLRASSRAYAAKTGFLGLWNPLASQLGQPTFTASQI
jgi:hypothetical protein